MSFVKALRIISTSDRVGLRILLILLVFVILLGSLGFYAYSAQLEVSKMTCLFTNTERIIPSTPNEASVDGAIAVLKPMEQDISVNKELIMSDVEKERQSEAVKAAKGVYQAPVLVLPEPSEVPMQCKREVLALGVLRAGIAVSDDVNAAFESFYLWGVNVNCGQKWFREVRIAFYVCMVAQESDKERRDQWSKDLKLLLQEVRPGLEKNLEEELTVSQSFRNTLQNATSGLFQKRYKNSIPLIIQGLQKGEIVPNSPAWIQSYQNLHRSILDPENTSVTKKYLIFSCPEGPFWGGYGDRLKGITMLFIIALLTDRAFLIHHPSPSLSSSFSPNMISWELSEAEYREKAAGIQPLRWIDFGTMYNDDFEGSHFGNSPVVIIHHNQEGVMQLLKNSNYQNRIKELGLLDNDGAFLNSQIFNYLFKYSTNLKNSLKSFVAKNHEYETDPVIGIHIRTGRIMSSAGHKEETTTRVGPELADTFFEMAMNVEARKGLQNSKWYIASDNDLLKQCALNVYPGKVIVKEEKPIHTQDNQSPEEHVATSADQILLMGADILLFSRSGYSELAFEYGHFDCYSAFKYDVSFSHIDKKWWYNTCKRLYGPNVQTPYGNLETYPRIMST
eukprot:Nk52_evm8s1763 gene=Nk52_evmTU8s1763